MSSIQFLFQQSEVSEIRCSPILDGSDDVTVGDFRQPLSFRIVRRMWNNDKTLVLPTMQPLHPQASRMSRIERFFVPRRIQANVAKCN